MSLRDLRRKPATDLASMLRVEDMEPPPRQLAFPFAPPPADEPAPADVAQELEALLLEIVADVESLQHPARTCAARNPGACYHEACAIIREYRSRMAPRAAQARVVLGVRGPR